MTAAPRAALLSLEQWRALPDDGGVHVELQEGVLQVSPRPTPAHARILTDLLVALHAQLPDGFEVLPEVELVIDRRSPATVRCPDLIVRATEADDSVIDAGQVVLVVEIVSPGSKRTDRVTKRSEYAEIGIENYWIVDLDRTLTVLRLEGSEYTEMRCIGEYVTTAPFSLHIDLHG